MKNKKRGITFLEVTVVVALIGVIIAILGPTVRNYMKLGERYSYGITKTIEERISNDRIEEILGSVTIPKRALGDSGNKTTGLGSNAEYKEKPQEIRDIIKTPAASDAKKRGYLYIINPVLTNPENGTQKVVEGYHIFRIMNGKLIYSNSLDKDGFGGIFSNSDVVFKNQETIYPGNSSGVRIVGNDNYFEEIPQGALLKMTIEKDGVQTRLEKLFIKRGEA